MRHTLLGYCLIHSVTETVVLTVASRASTEKAGSNSLAARRSEEGVCVTGKVAPANILLSHRQPLTDAGPALDKVDKLKVAGAKERVAHATVAASASRSKGHARVLNASGFETQSADTHASLPLGVSLTLEHVAASAILATSRAYFITIAGTTFSSTWVVAIVAVTAIIIVIALPYCMWASQRRRRGFDSEIEDGEMHEAWYPGDHKGQTMREKAGALFHRAPAPKHDDSSSKKHQVTHHAHHTHGGGGNLHTRQAMAAKAKSACMAGGGSSSHYPAHLAGLVQHSHLAHQVGSEVEGIRHEAENDLARLGAAFDKTGAVLVDGVQDVAEFVGTASTSTLKATKKIFKKVRKAGEKMQDALEEEMDKAVYSAATGRDY